jgi:hypothetical protein
LCLLSIYARLSAPGVVSLPFGTQTYQKVHSENALDNRQSYAPGIGVPWILMSRHYEFVF